jgi:hypothetical protein
MENRVGILYANKLQGAEKLRSLIRHRLRHLAQGIRQVLIAVAFTAESVSAVSVSSWTQP